MSLVGVQQVALLEPEILGVAKLSGNVPKGITGTLANGSGAGFRRAIGMTGFVENVPDAEIREIAGDGGVIAQYQRQANGVISLASGFAVFDQVTMTELKNRTIYSSVGAFDISLRTRKCLTFDNMAVIVSGRCISQEAGTAGQEGWYTILYWLLTGQEQPFNLTIAQETPSGINFSANEADTTWWEEDMNTNYGQSYSWATDPIIGDYPMWCHTYVGDNSTTTTTLDYLPPTADGNNVIYWKDGTKQTYTTNYTVSTTTGVVTFVAAPASATDNVFLYTYVPSC